MKKTISDEQKASLKRLGYDVRLVSGCAHRVYWHDTYIGEGGVRSDEEGWRIAEHHHKKASKS